MQHDRHTAAIEQGVTAGTTSSFTLAATRPRPLVALWPEQLTGSCGRLTSRNSGCENNSSSAHGAKRGKGEKRRRKKKS